MSSPSSVPLQLPSSWSYTKILIFEINLPSILPDSFIKLPLYKDTLTYKSRPALCLRSESSPKLVSCWNRRKFKKWYKIGEYYLVLWGREPHYESILGENIEIFFQMNHNKLKILFCLWRIREWVNEVIGSERLHSNDLTLH